MFVCDGEFFLLLSGETCVDHVLALAFQYFEYLNNWNLFDH